jgi:ADP-ribose pyrophosphatase YjhB (NUDIX family)
MRVLSYSTKGKLMDKFFKHSVKAIIIKDGKLLVESVDYGRGRYCKLPGGGQEWGETMQQTIIRECKEELNLDVTPLRLVLARDYIAKNHNQSYDLDCFHLAELMFECEVTDFTPLGNGSEPDSDAQKIKWIELDQLAASDFYPKAIIPYLQNIKDIKETVVLGDVN